MTEKNKEKLNNMSKDVEKTNASINVVSVDQEKSPLEVNGDFIETEKADAAYEYALRTKGMVLTDEKNKAIRRKCDIYVMPLMAIAYGLQFLDKSTSSYAAIMGLEEDIGPMVGNMYSWTSTCFFLGYLFWSFPGSYSLQKLPLAKAVSGYIILWGVVLVLHAATYNYPGFIVCRTFLGIFEAPLLTGLSLITNNFYHKSEQYARTCFYFSFCGLANIIGSCLSSLIQTHSANFTIESWKVLFMLLGFVTIVLGIVMMLIIPDLPTQAWWLTEEERLLTVERIRDNEQGFGSAVFKWYQVKEALLEPRSWAYFLLAICVDIPNGGITTFTSILLNTEFKYGTNKALLMKAPMGVVQLVGLGALGFANKYKLVKHPLLLSIFGMSVTLTAGCLLAFGPNKQVKLAGLYLVGFSPVTMITALSGLSTNTAGRTKKVVGNGIYLVGFCAGSAIGPQMFISSEAPIYPTAKHGIVGFYAGCWVLLVSLAFYNWNENRLRDKKRLEMGDSYKKFENSEFADMTDRENFDFRYTW